MKKAYFYELMDKAEQRLQKGEELILAFHGEDSDFCRFNQGKVRQIGKVHHDRLLVRLVKDNRHALYELTLTGQMAEDITRVASTLSSLRAMIPHLPADPYLIQNREPTSSERVESNRLPSIEQWTEAVRHEVGDLDFVGIQAAGGMYRGFANTLGQRNWYENYSFNLDWSVYHETDKAVKDNYAGFSWDNQSLKGKLQNCREQLEHLKKPSITIKPGAYRVYLTPMAMAEVMSLLEWRAFGLKSQRTKSSPLRRLVEGKQVLSPMIHLSEDVSGGMAPDFDEFGFTKPDAVSLIAGGRHQGALVSARSSREYQLPPTGAHEGESPESLYLQPGALKPNSILRELGDGLYISNLWYMNFSDPETCRMTGMTRFASFWVQNSQIQGPVNVMRFDESLYRMLGDNLLGLTDRSDMLLSSSTYDSRSTHSMRLPGALIDRFAFTL
ncbi:MAG TPA: metallopeptidase TldD-related protein [Oligoflexus sp.]|uniref:TldD/PmbA family protein n=1 Tax=Oligoflexus sp. TaxID=1971216 RepID=UPI002D305FB4|nr:metallopeptidase TldD-related protein [Oligoflexus sp.]HYX39911.1 metallopeptidase TldD-related protein [Oligoflexus sp.]